MNTIKKLFKKRITRKGLVRKLDKVVSEIVRDRDKRCVLCGTRNNLTAGHLFSRVAYSTRWDLNNVWCQCMGCNFRHEYDAYPFYEWYTKNHSKAAFNRLHRKYETPKKYKDHDLEELYKKLVKMRDLYEDPNNY
jgi:5-methylcytosine-specific restriction endonuclease McrA